jgi:hypothetical protein
MILEKLQLRREFSWSYLMKKNDILELKQIMKKYSQMHLLFSHNEKLS